MCEEVEAAHLSMDQCPAHNSNSSWLILVAFGIALFISGSGIFLLFFPTTEEKRTFQEVDVATLSEEEKKAYDYIKGHEGSAYQSDIMKEMQWSKVQTTRILDKLETKGILERKRRGMTNIIVLR